MALITMHPPSTTAAALGGGVDTNGNVGNSVVVGGGGFVVNNTNIEALIANALQNPELSSSVQVLLQTMNYMNAQTQTLMPTPAVNNGMAMAAVQAASPAVINGNTIMAPTSLVVPSNSSMMVQQQTAPVFGFNSVPRQQHGGNMIFNTNIMSNNSPAVNNGMAAVQAASSPAIMAPNSSGVPNSSMMVQQVQQQAPVFGFHSGPGQQQPGGNTTHSTVPGVANFNTNIMPNNSNPSWTTTVTPAISATPQPQPHLPTNNSHPSWITVTPAVLATPAVTPAVLATTPQPQPQQHPPIINTSNIHNVVYDSSGHGNCQNNTSYHQSNHSLGGNSNSGSDNNDFEPTDFRTTTPGQGVAVTCTTANVNETAVAQENEENECLDLLLDNSFLNDYDNGNMGNSSNNNRGSNAGARAATGAIIAAPALVPAVSANYGNKEQPQPSSSSQQQPQPPSQQQPGQEQPSQQQLQMQERLRQVSQQQMQQFCVMQMRQQQLREQQLVKMQFLQQQQQQQHQPLQPQSSVMSMQSDLHALQAMRDQGSTNNTVNSSNPDGNVNSSGQDPSQGLVNTTYINAGNQAVTSNGIEVTPNGIEVTPNGNGLASQSVNAHTSIGAVGIKQLYYNNAVPNHVPLEPNQRQQCIKQQQQQRKRTARSTSKASHNPRADNSSNWDANPKKHQQQQQQVVSNIHPAIGNHPNPPRRHHYVKVVGGGVKRPASMMPRAPSLPQAHVTKKLKTTAIPSAATVASNTGIAQQAGPLPNKRIRQSAPASSSRSSSTSSLQDHLDTLLSSRGYTPTKRPASQLGYRQPPTQLQLASFGFAVCSTIKPNGADRLTALLRSGLSPNPTNKFGDSPFFMACKRGLYPLVKVFVENGAEVRVADGFGRTPLHYVAWANPPCLQSARLLLEADARLLYVMDAHGKTPLDFVGNDAAHRSTWIDFLEGVKDDFWPVICNNNSGSGSTSMGYSPEARDGRSSSGIPDPKEALSVQLAEKVASGHIMPEEAKRQQQQQVQCNDKV